MSPGHFGRNFLVLAFGLIADAIGLPSALTVYGVIFGSLLGLAGLFVLRRSQ